MTGEHLREHETRRGQSLARGRPQACREHFIPVRKADLVNTLAGDASLGEEDRLKFRQLCRLLEATIHFQYHELLESLKDAYAHFDPDADTIRLNAAEDDPPGEAVEKLFEQFRQLLERANYQKLPQSAIEEAIKTAGDWGFHLDIDFDVFDRLDIFARGLVDKTYRRRRWQRLFRLEQLHSHVYQRLVVIFRLKPHPRLPQHGDPATVYMKVFKDIPKMDLDSLLPGSRVKMTLLDQGKVLLPTASGVLVTIVKVVVAASMGLVTFLGLVVGTIGYGVKSFFGFLHTKEKHQLNLTKNLYFQNLDNNAGVLFHLLDDAEEQECREAILAYFLLWKRAPPEGWTEQELDHAAEQYLRQALGVDADFEVEDAVAKLQRFRLAQLNANRRLTAVGVDEALVRLDQAWDNFFPFANP